MKNVPIVPIEEKNKFNNTRKLTVGFDRAMSNIYKNNIFPTLPYAVVEIRDITKPACV